MTSLPDALALRTRSLNDASPGGGEFILYWMRTAVRAHENPALEAALRLANSLDKPLFVYHAVSERYRYASDRHHTFILQGARDVARQLAARGIGTAFHCEREGHRGRHLESLAHQAAAVFTEDMPVSPLRNWTRALADSLNVPMFAVDTATVVPMRFVGKRITRAFQYRSRVQPVIERFLTPCDETAPKHAPFVPPLPFVPIDWATDQIADLVADCDIDHTVGPVPHTRGGSSAGYTRWRDFLATGLSRYGRTRNDPNKHGVSRLSAYLHYGMVAPTRIAREALDHGGKGADKFVDELIVWREMAYTWCLYSRHHETPEALPEWAVATLHRHTADPRPPIDREQLQRGRTGTLLWDLCQASLRIHGELHNNVRMTWGKAVVQWTDTPEDALRTLVDLNHRYALDGRDPASYGGLLWCLGQFDRPFPESPCFGTIRSRSIAQHAKRLDLDRYRRHVTRPLVAKPPRVAVIGGGPAGALCARTLHDHAVPVVVYDKGRGAGGRLSTRRSGDLRFDHGAQYFTATQRTLAYHIDAWCDAGVIAPWEGPFGVLGPDGFTEHPPASPRFVGTPSMSALVKHLLADVDARFGVRVTALAQKGGGWDIHDETGVIDHVDEVVIAVPAPQAVPLLGHHPFAQQLASVEVSPCWAALVTLAGDPGVGWSAVTTQGPLAWIARNQTKPGRPHGEQWVLHASPAWSAASLERNADIVGPRMVDALTALPGLEHLVIDTVRAHRWRYALVTRSLDTDALRDADAHLTVVGDGLRGGRVAAALQSGAAGAARILGGLEGPESTERLFPR